jgi:hypothetical protein
MNHLPVGQVPILDFSSWLMFAARVKGKLSYEAKPLLIISREEHQPQGWKSTL